MTVSLAVTVTVTGAAAVQMELSLLPLLPSEELLAGAEPLADEEPPPKPVPELTEDVAAAAAMSLAFALAVAGTGKTVTTLVRVEVEKSVVVRSVEEASVVASVGAAAVPLATPPDDAGLVAVTVWSLSVPATHCTKISELTMMRVWVAVRWIVVVTTVLEEPVPRV